MEASIQKNLSSAFVKNKGTDQPGHPHSMIRAFAIRLLESLISTLATSIIEP